MKGAQAAAARAPTVRGVILLDPGLEFPESGGVRLPGAKWVPSSLK